MTTLEAKIRSRIAAPRGSYARTLGRTVQVWREERGLSGIEMAEHLGVSQSTYSRLETGDTTMTVQQLDLICARLGVNIETITEQVRVIENG